MNKLSLRMRLTIMTTLLLTVSCVILTIIINFSAMKMATQIQMSALTPAYPVQQEVALQPELLEQSEQTTPAIALTHVELSKKNFHWEIVCYLIFVTMGGSLLTWYISGRSLSRVRSLSDQVKNITVNNLSELMDVPPTNDEVAELTLSFNEMTERLLNAFESQSRFVQNAAHELRTPLAVLQTKLDVFKKKESHTMIEYESLIRVMESHTLRLSSLVKNLLNLAYMDEMECNERINLYDTLLVVLEDLAVVSNEKRVQLRLSGDKPIVYGNSQFMYQAFYNLIENAIKYNIEGGLVSVTVRMEVEQVVVLVSDTGIGIPKEMREQIFEPFFRVDKSRSRQMGGAGLGLSIVRSIVDHHKGNISVYDNQPFGTCFELTFHRKSI